MPLADVSALDSLVGLYLFFFDIGMPDELQSVCTFSSMPLLSPCTASSFGGTRTSAIFLIQSSGTQGHCEQPTEAAAGSLFRPKSPAMLASHVCSIRIPSLPFYHTSEIVYTKLF